MFEGRDSIGRNYFAFYSFVYKLLVCTNMSLSPMSSFSPTSAPQTMLRNPSGCQKFVVNVFKAGSGRCRDCGHEWFQHEGVIDKAIAEKFRSIWASGGERKPSPIASGVPPLPLQSLNQTPIKTMKDLKEEKKRALLAKRNNKGEDWYNGGGDSARSSRSNVRSVDENDSEDEFRFYSKEEFLAKESARSGLSGNVTNGGKPLKVVNLIDFENKDSTPTNKFGESPRVSLPIPPVSEVVVSSEQLRAMEELMRSLQSQLHEKENMVTQLMTKVQEQDLELSAKHRQEIAASDDSLKLKISQLENLLHEKDTVASTAKAESSRLLDELDRVMLESNRKVRELEELVDKRVEEQELTQKKLEGKDREIEILHARIEQGQQTETTEQKEQQARLSEYHDRIASMERELAENQSRIAELESTGQIMRDRVESLVNQLDGKNTEIENLKTELSIRPVTDLSEEVTKLQSEKAELFAKISEIERKNFALENELSASSSRESKLQTDVEFYHKKTDELKEVAASQDSEIVKLRKEIGESEVHASNLSLQLMERKQELENLRSETSNQTDVLRDEFARESNRMNAECARLRSENEMMSVRVTENAEQLRIERNNSVEIQGRLLRAEETILELNEKLKQSSDELNNSMRMGSNFDQVRETNEQYLDAIADVAIVLRTACDKYLTPHSSMANSRVHSLEDIGVGPEAIRVLETNVKSVLRMIDNVYEKCRYLEKENTKLETNIYDLQLINQSLKEKMNKSFVQRLFEPMMSCGLPGSSSPASGGGQGNSPIVRNYLVDSNREMSHLLPPGQVSMMDDPDVH